MTHPALLQSRLSELDGAAGIRASPHIHHTLGAEVHAGGLSGGACVIDDNAADSTRIVHKVLPNRDRSRADVVGDDVSIAAGAHQPAYEQIVIVRPAREGDVGIEKLGVGRACQIVDSETEQTAIRSGIHGGICVESDPIVSGLPVVGGRSTAHEEVAIRGCGAEVSVIKSAAVNIPIGNVNSLATTTDVDAHRQGEVLVELDHNSAVAIVSVIAGKGKNLTDRAVENDGIRDTERAAIRVAVRPRDRTSWRIATGQPPPPIITGPANRLGVAPLALMVQSSPSWSPTIKRPV